MADDDGAFGFGRAFPAESRAHLGLSDSEDLRVLARSGRVILLERGDGGGGAVPWDRDLVLSSDVRAFALADLLSLVHGAGKSGYLLFQYEREEKAVYLSRGEVVFAESKLTGRGALGASNASVEANARSVREPDVRSTGRSA